jgi:hypothetical protein
MNNNRLDLEEQTEEAYNMFRDILDELRAKNEFKLSSDLSNVYHRISRIRYDAGVAMVKEIYDNIDND